MIKQRLVDRREPVAPAHYLSLHESRWQPLPDALQLVMAHNGISKDDAQRVICQAVADRAIGIRCRLREHATRHMTSRDVLEGKAFQIPDVLQPGDLNWEGSHPVQPWFVSRGAYSPSGRWHLAWIELSTTDLASAFCMRTPDGPNQLPGTNGLTRSPPGLRLEPTRAESIRSRGPRGVKLNATIEAMNEQIREGKIGPADLECMLEKRLAAKYNVSRDTARKARLLVLSEFNSRQTPTNDK